MQEFYIILSSTEGHVSHERYTTVTAKGVIKTKKAGKNKKVIITATALDGSNKRTSVRIFIK